MIALVLLAAAALNAAFWFARITADILLEHAAKRRVIARSGAGR